MSIKPVGLVVHIVFMFPYLPVDVESNSDPTLKKSKNKRKFDKVKEENQDEQQSKKKKKKKRV